MVASWRAPAAVVPEQFPGAGVEVVVVVTFVSPSRVEVAPSTRTLTAAGVPASAGALAASAAIAEAVTSAVMRLLLFLLCMVCSFAGLFVLVGKARGRGRRRWHGGTGSSR